MGKNKITSVQESSNSRKLQKKALQIINFLPKTAPVKEIYKNSKILKISDYISLATKCPPCKRLFQCKSSRNFLEILC